MTCREELLVKAVDILNKVKGLNYYVSEVKESNNEVSCYCVFPSGHQQELGFIKDWFEDNWICPYISTIAAKKIPDNIPLDEKIIMRFIAWFWENRNFD